jgi:hypothetical protein
MHAMKARQVWGIRILAADVFLEHVAVWRMPQAANSFFLDLSDALTCQFELFANFLERKRIFHADTEVRANYIGFARGQC